MRIFFLTLVYWIFRFLLTLRYRVKVEGVSAIKKAGKKGVLFLPNHPAEMDPLILTLVLWPTFKPRPLVVEHFYYQKFFRSFMDLVGVLPIPSMETANQWKVGQVDKLKAKIVKKLKEGENFLIYPSGKLKRTPDERLGGASMVPDILKMNPNIQVVLVRTTGLWGSSFSTALTGMSPNFKEVLWHGLKVLLKNGLFFAPKREVRVELALPGDDFPRGAEKLILNEWLEKWYNIRGPEKLKFVSFAFWKEEFPEMKIQKMRKEEASLPISEEARIRILGHLAKVTRKPIDQIKPEFHLMNDLGLDSLDVGQLYVFLEERFDVEDLAVGQLQTVHDLFQAAAGVKKEREGQPIEKKSRWPAESFRPEPSMPSGDTLQEVFLKNCDRMKDFIACADATSGTLSYKKLKRRALVLSLKIQEMPGDHIGILLPSSVGGYIAILATLLAGKIPVMLNWTTGFRNLEHVASICDLKVVVSSYRFLSKLEVCDLGKVDDRLVFLEKLRGEIHFSTKIRGLIRSCLPYKNILKPAKKEDTAAIIFTSGTETLPKGVPLTHSNLLDNQRSALSCVSFNAKDSLYGVLPPFHSFGFSVTGILPLLIGLRVCYSPDPTDSRTLASDIEYWSPTLFCCAPSFVTGLVRVASDSQLESLRLIVTGAEKAPQMLIDTLVAKGKTVLEGYGISECSPIVTLQREHEPKKGVGKAIPNVELCVIDPETDQVLGFEKEGEICICGPGVFRGYISGENDPFITLNGKKWYRSGDRGMLDDSGYLTLTGRLKRFVKIGGEMVSLGGLEEDILSIAKERGWVSKDADEPLIAVVANGRESDKPGLILFATVDINREELNSALKTLGVGRIIKIAEIRKLNEIPITGTGKIHYRLLDETI